MGFDHSGSASLEAALAVVCERARAAFPAVQLETPRFAAFVRSRLESAEDPVVALGKLHVEHLFLACACGQGDPAALAELDRSFFPQLDGAMIRAGVGAQLDDVKQRVREKLLASTEGRPPRILDYGGRSDLLPWLRAVAVRTAIDVIRVTPPAGGDERLAEMAAPSDEPELRLLKERYGDVFRAAVREAVQSLEPEARRDLQLYYFEGHGLVALAAIRRTSVATMSRRLAAARAGIYAATRDWARARLSLTDGDVESLLRVVQSRLELGPSAFELAPGTRKD